MNESKLKILIYDEDTYSGTIEEFCERLERLGETAEQVTDWNRLPDRIREFKPDALLIDLMIPALGLPSDECGDGYTTGAYVYRSKARDIGHQIPFAVFTAADIKTTRIRKAIDSLKSLPEYRGTFQKGEDAEVVLAALRGKTGVATGVL
jgi:CheY-like chemotaxis protein